MDLEEEAPEIIMIKIGSEMIMIVFIVFFIKDIRRR